MDMKININWAWNCAKSTAKIREKETKKLEIFKFQRGQSCLTGKYAGTRNNAKQSHFCMYGNRWHRIKTLQIFAETSDVYKIYSFLCPEFIPIMNRNDHDAL